jgi:F0F1-type ATP synthase membrane subunit a
MNKMKSPLEQFDIINVKSIYTSFIDISFNNILIPFLFLIIATTFYLFIFNKQLTIIPTYFQNIIENIYILLINLVKQQAHYYGLI